MCLYTVGWKLVVSSERVVNTEMIDNSAGARVPASSDYYSAPVIILPMTFKFNIPTLKDRRRPPLRHE